MKTWWRCTLWLGLLAGIAPVDAQEDLLATFRDPPGDARPGVYWYFMDGNQDRSEMVADLESMHQVGIGSVIYLEVDIGVPKGPVRFMTPAWQDNVAHAVKTTERLGMEFILGTGPGWAGSGGSWVPPEESMQHLVGESVAVEGPVWFQQQLAVPAPHTANRFAGMTEAHQGLRNQWYQDEAVLAYPCPDTPAPIQDQDIKTLKDVRPYTIDKTAPRFVTMPSHYEEPAEANVLNPARVIELTDKMNRDGTLSWDVPAGRWRIFRFVARSTGQTTRPAPETGHGFECDKMNPAAFRNHWTNFQGELLKKVQPGKNGAGWTRIHLDSWEMSSQNWTPAMRQEFSTRRGYDPLPYYPAFLGLTVGSLEQTERFLWDLRTTAQELVMENHAQVIKQIAHAHGMLYSNEPYDMNPAGDIDLGSVADIPMCEFWHEGCHDAVYSCIEAVSIAHVMGRPVVAAESFTASAPTVRFEPYPGRMKNQLDWAFALGINSVFFHTYQHQPLGENYRPGMYMGRYGVNWHRHQTWWNMLPAFHDYVARCSHMLRQGAPVADILYLTPAGAPHVFLPPPSAMEGANQHLLDKKGYAFDAVTPSILLNRASVEDGLITFPAGGRYRVLVLPASARMTPGVLRKIAALVEQGAIVIGNPPVKSPSLVDFPACDQVVQETARTMWGGLEPPETASVREVGKGAVYWGGQWTAPEHTSVYPPYEQTQAVLEELNHHPDFSASRNVIRYIHRRTVDEEIYFVSNRTGEPQSVDCTFRVKDQRPMLWDPVTGDARPLPEFEPGSTGTTVPLQFAPHESFFVVFSPHGRPGPTDEKNFADFTALSTVRGSWSVSFDPDGGGPARIEFPELIDWRDHTERGIRFYSGTAVYRNHFDRPAGADLHDTIVLDLGTVYEMARVTLNGKELGIVWTPPYQVTVDTHLLKAKHNELVIDVANSWENRIIGDHRTPDRSARTVQWASGLLGGKSFTAGRYTFSSHDRDYKKQPQPSGLIGPVVLKRASD